MMGRFLLPKYINLLQDPDNTIRNAAAFALGRSENPLAIEALIHALSQQGINPGFRADLVLILSGAAGQFSQANARTIVEQNTQLFVYPQTEQS